MQAKYSNIAVSHQAYTRVEIILRETTGLNSASIGSSFIVNSIRRRMVACSQSNVEAYLVRLLASAEELDALIEEVVIPETWFFRDAKAFTALCQFVANEWMPEHKQRKLHVLSLPCSTGEEPYSIAMTLKDSGLPTERIHIDAVDISTQSLARAQRAVYSNNAFRGDDIAYRDRFFHSTDTGYVLDETIQQSINFIQANMLDAAFMPGQEMYDVIFCRNVMIYFDRATQTQAAGILSRLLKPMGILFVGHAESSVILNHGYVSEQISHAFAFRKVKSEFRSKPYLKVTADAQLQQQKKVSPASLFQSRTAFGSPSAAGEESLVDDNLEQAFCMANKGNLAEAARLCESWLQDNESCARACYLLGLIHEATGNYQQAEDYLRKAIYLQPDHQEALVHLALLVEQKGDSSVARVLRQRAQRIEE